MDGSLSLTAVGFRGVWISLSYIGTSLVDQMSGMPHSSHCRRISSGQMLA